MSIAHLPHRGVIEVAGPDRAAFLQGLISNDVEALRPDAAVWAALLTPQGKWLADFFVLDAGGEAWLLDVERAQAEMLVQRLSRFRLRAKVALRDASAEWHVHAAWDANPPEGVLAARDPRLPEAGWRVLAPQKLADAGVEDYDRYRLALGLPDGARDLDAEKTVLLEAGFDELHGVSWTKGCYMGQELTARTKYRGLVKKRLCPVRVEGPLPPHGTPVLHEGRELGEMRSGRDGRGLALLRLEALRAGPLACGDAVLTPEPPGWMNLPAETADAG